MIITDIKESPKLTKRFRSKLSNGQEIDFGLDGASTYIDHHNEIKSCATALSTLIILGVD